MSTNSPSWQLTRNSIVPTGSRSVAHWQTKPLSRGKTHLDLHEKRQENRYKIHVHFAIQTRRLPRAVVTSWCTDLRQMRCQLRSSKQQNATCRYMSGRFPWTADRWVRSITIVTRPDGVSVLGARSMMENSFAGGALELTESIHA